MRAAPAVGSQSGSATQKRRFINRLPKLALGLGNLNPATFRLQNPMQAPPVVGSQSGSATQKRAVAKSRRSPADRWRPGYATVTTQSLICKLGEKKTSGSNKWINWKTARVILNKVLLLQNRNNPKFVAQVVRHLFQLPSKSIWRFPAITSLIDDAALPNRINCERLRTRKTNPITSWIDYVPINSIRKFLSFLGIFLTPLRQQLT